MPRLVALDLDGGDDFVAALRALWERGDAVLPLDRRLPRAAAAQLAMTMGARSVVDSDGEHVIGEGRPTEVGDALVVATSGSTGTPKGVVLTHDALAASSTATHRRLRVTPSDHWLACLPLSHVGGLCVVTRALISGLALTVLPRFDAEAVTAAAARGATLTSLVATALGRIDAGIFRTILLGGGRPPEDRPPNTVATYGMTETGSGVVYDGVPLDGVEVDIADDGEVLLRGPMLMRTYRDGTTNIDRAGWLHTDDVGRWLDDGRLHVDGRRGDLIITGGENVWPDVVEAALRRHPDVAEAAVAGIDDAEWGQRVAAWIVLRDPSRPPTLDELRDVVRLTLPAFMAPRSVEIVSDLPRTNSGKIRRNTLSGVRRRPG